MPKLEGWLIDLSLSIDDYTQLDGLAYCLEKAFFGQEVSNLDPITISSVTWGDTSSFGSSKFGDIISSVTWGDTSSFGSSVVDYTITLSSVSLGNQTRFGSPLEIEVQNFLTIHSGSLS